MRLLSRKEFLSCPNGTVFGCVTNEREYSSIIGGAQIELIGIKRKTVGDSYTFEQIYPFCLTEDFIELSCKDEYGIIPRLSHGEMRDDGYCDYFVVLDNGDVENMIKILLFSYHTAYRNGEDIDWNKVMYGNS